VYSDSFSRGMRELGHDAQEILYDVEPLQRAWARENGVALDDRNWEQIVLHRQIATLRPDIVYCQDIHSTPYRLRRSLKSLVRSIRLVVVHKGFPGAFDELDDVDLLMLGVPSLVRIYRERGMACELTYHGFNDRVPELLEQPAPDETRHEFTFVGSSGYAYGKDQRDRYWTLMRLMRDTAIRPFLNEPFVRPLGAAGAIAQRLAVGDDMASRAVQWGIRHLPNAGPVRRLREVFDETASCAAWRKKPAEELGLEEVPPVPLCRVFPGRCRDAVYGLDMYRTLRASDITFNIHTNGAFGDVGNMRMYEATGVGTCLLTDTGSNMSDLYEPDREVVTYKSYPELLEKLRYLQEHPAERQKIAEAGRQRTLRDHTIRRRVEHIDDLVQRKLHGQRRSY
jgi:spore maturation protein CgeB